MLVEIGSVLEESLSKHRTENPAPRVMAQLGRCGGNRDIKKGCYVTSSLCEDVGVPKRRKTEARPMKSV